MNILVIPITITESKRLNRPIVLLISTTMRTEQEIEINI